MSSQAAPPRVGPGDTTVLDLGCGRAKRAGALGVDLAEHAHADIHHDLNRFPYPLPEGHFTSVLCRDVVEHLEDVTGFVREVHRLCAPGAVVEIRTPHYSSAYAYNDPTHRHAFGYFFLDHYTQPSAILPAPLFRYVERRLLFPRVHRLNGVSALANRFPARYEQLFAFLFPCENLLVRMAAVKQGGVAAIRER